jgi:hypothetical protein
MLTTNKRTYLRIVAIIVRVDAKLENFLGPHNLH